MGKHYYKAGGMNLPIFDMVVTLTALDMCTMKGSSCRKSTVGYAYVGGACVTNKRLQKINSVAIVEDNGGYSGVIIAAHEVAHLLGAVHDGDSSLASLGGPGASSCSKSNGFIMSDNRRTKRGVRWSSCTKAQISHFLSSSTASCLLNSPSSKDNSLRDLPYLTENAPSLDEQCYQELGTRSCFSDARVCSQLFCLNPVTGSCVSYRPAVEGSKCGSSGVCQNGECKIGKRISSVQKIPRRPRKETSEAEKCETIKRS